MIARPSNIRIVPRELRQKTSVELFKLGFDTADIAFFKELPEAHIYSMLNDERERQYHRRVDARIAASFARRTAELQAN